MSQKLNEDKLQKRVYEIISGYGRQADFHIKDDNDSPYTTWITPPRNTRELEAGSNAEEDLVQFLISTKDLEFDPYRTMKVIDSKDSQTYRVIKVDPIDSGLITTAYRIRAAK